LQFKVINLKGKIDSNEANDYSEIIRFDTLKQGDTDFYRI